MFQLYSTFDAFPIGKPIRCAFDELVARVEFALGYGRGLLRCSKSADPTGGSIIGPDGVAVCTYGAI